MWPSNVARYAGCVVHLAVQRAWLRFGLGLGLVALIPSPACVDAGFERLGIEGASCQASTDCTRPLECIELVCSDPDVETESTGGESGAETPSEDPQTDEGITYPFKSYTGDITFEEPVVGNRTLDFNTEGMVHLGLVAELIEDVRRDGVTDQELEPLFKSAEGYIRMWEKSVARSQNLDN